MNDPSESITALAQRSCVPCEGGVAAMGEEQIMELLEDLPGWSYVNGALTRTFKLKSYVRTMALANAVAWIAEREDHHPELVVGYRTLEVRYRTHSIGGLSENDFISAAKVDLLLA